MSSYAMSHVIKQLCSTMSHVIKQLCSTSILKLQKCKYCHDSAHCRRSSYFKHGLYMYISASEHVMKLILTVYVWFLNETQGSECVPGRCPKLQNLWAGA